MKHGSDVCRGGCGWEGVGYVGGVCGGGVWGGNCVPVDISQFLTHRRCLGANVFDTSVNTFN